MWFGTKFNLFKSGFLMCYGCNSLENIFSCNVVGHPRSASPNRFFFGICPFPDFSFVFPFCGLLPLACPAFSLSTTAFDADISALVWNFVIGWGGLELVPFLMNGFAKKFEAYFDLSASHRCI